MCVYGSARAIHPLCFSERANRSILQLTDVLGDPSCEEESMDKGGGQQTDSIVGEESWHQLQHSDAGPQSRIL